jgi:hypothetical protein
VQLGEFLKADNHNWIMAFCKFLPRSKQEWQALAYDAAHQQDPRSQKARGAGNDSVTFQTQKAALHHMVNHLPCLESVLMQHVNATVSNDLEWQLHVLPPSLHAAACNSHL